MGRPNLLLLHGWAYDASVFSRLVPLLDDAFVVHAPDLAPLWEEREAALARIITGAPGCWYGCGWSLGFLLMLELQQRGLLSRAAGLCALPRFTGPGGMDPETIRAMREGLATQPERILRKFGQWAAFPERQAALPPGGPAPWLADALTLLEKTTLTDTAAPLLLAGRDAVLPPAAATGTPHGPVTWLAEAGHLLPWTHPEETAAWIRLQLL